MSDERQPQVAASAIPDAQEMEVPPTTEDFVLELSPNSVLNERYRIVEKLGAGQHSTVWLAKDTKADSPDTVYAIKVLNTIATSLQGSIAHELEVLQIIKETAVRLPEATGAAHVLQLLDHFTVTYAHGSHLALVMPVLGHSLQELQGRFEDRMIHPNLVRDVIRQLLEALVFLHDECKVVHTDIKQDNLMLNDYGGQDKPAMGTAFVLTDLSTAEPEHGEHKRLIQPEALRCPEAAANLEWGTAADIWNVGCLVFELITGKILFPVQDLRNEDGAVAITRDQWRFAHFWAFVRRLEDTDEKLCAFFSRSDVGRALFGTDGKLSVNVDQHRSLEQILLNYEVEDPELADFLGCMLRLLPEDRAPARELLKHAWLSIEDAMELKSEVEDGESVEAVAQKDP
ncbi:unnamed protein product [Peniophora sp. CBMAI 1063]|nr:unnamed protein product [Peniophora sp. CBMAI 1063]